MLLDQYKVQHTQEPQSSYHSPTNLFLMDLNNDTKVTQHGAMWVITRTLPLSGLSVATVLGAQQGSLLEELSQTFDIVECTEEPEVPYFEDRDNAEYVYAVSETAEMRGKNYEEVRRKYNRVNKQIYKCQISKLELLADMDVQTSIWKFFESQLNSTNIDARVEVLAFEKWLMFAEQLSTDLIVVAEDSKIVGFSVVEVVGKTLLIHFFKTDHAVSGLAEYLFVEIARMYQGEVEWINFQQDLGIDGLRRFKEHLQPSLQIQLCILQD